MELLAAAYASDAEEEEEEAEKEEAEKEEVEEVSLLPYRVLAAPVVRQEAVRAVVEERGRAAEALQGERARRGRVERNVAQLGRERATGSGVVTAAAVDAQAFRTQYDAFNTRGYAEDSAAAQGSVGSVVRDSTRRHPQGQQALPESSKDALRRRRCEREALERERIEMGLLPETSAVAVSSRLKKAHRHHKKSKKSKKSEKKKGKKSSSNSNGSSSDDDEREESDVSAESGGEAGADAGLGLGDEMEGPWAPERRREVAKPELTEEQKTFIAGMRKTKRARRDGGGNQDNDDNDGNGNDNASRRDDGAGLAKRSRLAQEDDAVEDGAAEAKSGDGDRAPAELEPTTTFHGMAEFDYQGRAWTHAPGGVRPDDGDHPARLPKRCIHRYTGHTRGVQEIEFFPGTGHLLLSGGMDGKAKIWDVHNRRHVLRTYVGHSQAIRSISFNNDGTRFLTSGFDRRIRLWDTETGQVVRTFSNHKVGFCVRFYPLDDRVFLQASADKKIVQWDCNTGEIQQEYDHHLGQVNSLVFVDEARRFVSSSDDKKMLVWDYNTPVPIKYIAEPDMHSVPSLSLHPSGRYFLGQSLDNKIVVYTAGERVREVKKKVFRGHNNSGYACQVSFSPNGQYVCSGDGLGKLYFWDWKTARIFQRYQAHDGGPCITTAWHPLEPSRVASAGWDAVIKLWD